MVACLERHGSVARRPAETKGWFIALLIINTAGILDIIYLLITNSEKDDKIKERALIKEIEENKN